MTVGFCVRDSHCAEHLSFPHVSLSLSHTLSPLLQLSAQLPSALQFCFAESQALSPSQVNVHA